METKKPVTFAEAIEKVNQSMLDIAKAFGDVPKTRAELIYESIYQHTYNIFHSAFTWLLVIPTAAIKAIIDSAKEVWIN